MSRFVIQYPNGNYACEFGNYSWPEGVRTCIGTPDLQKARVFGNVANAKSCKGWTEGAQVVEIVIKTVEEIEDEALEALEAATRWED